MALASLLAVDRIACLDDAGDRDEVLEAAARLIAAGTDVDGVAASLRQRERMGSTAIGDGVAIPHGRSAAFPQARAAFLRLRPAVAFGAADGTPVDLVFAMAVPEGMQQEYLQWLSELAERFADPAFRDTLRGAVDARALHAALRDAGMAP
ncbi:PTS sugar transporter subunit IIA [Pseudoluteimonas lycopersici]|uniref:PTS sugar transporter subunit IIA n=1 Tax=Pseudoluteimonas lycopersici TaxID=1324796 RepID=A0A516V4Q8_9GAMM|nr:PTS sugar transporter subunit IIA [Lysobacter lycopersici]QDQ73504.1 PTS sugar transporter subunit IIA [Lysobacter lycopersici]